MIHSLRILWRHHPRLSLAFALTSLLALAFLTRFLFALVYWSAHHEEPLGPWMTVGYVARSWDVSPPVLNDLLGLGRPEGKPMTLQDIAQLRGIPVEDLMVEVRAAVDTARAMQR